MSREEIDSFIVKFKTLLLSGKKATLVLKSDNGKAEVSLNVELGEVLPNPVHGGRPVPPLNLPRNLGQPFRQQRGPAYQRRQERRRQASGKAAEQVKHVAVEASEGRAAAKAGEASTVSAEEKPSDQTAEQAGNNFPCIICDFVSNWESGLLIHMTKKHLTMEQVDGNVTLKEDDLLEDDKYLETCHYWKTGRLGSVFQAFMDANEIIDSSNFPEELKEKEKVKILEARKSAFGENYEHVPPWNQRW